MFLFLKVIEKQYDEKQWKLEYPSSPFCFAEDEKLSIRYNSKTEGWSVKQVGQPEVNFYMDGLITCHDYDCRFHMMISNIGKLIKKL